MPTSKHEPAIGSPPHGQAKLPYRAPKLEVLGSLRSATRGSSGFLADMGTMRMFAVMMSDRRLKEDIVRIGQHALGLGIYRFRYKAPYAEIYGAGRRIGVMADEVAEKYPDAVCRHRDGHLMVDYGLLFH